MKRNRTFGVIILQNLDGLCAPFKHNERSRIDYKINSVKVIELYGGQGSTNQLLELDHVIRLVTDLLINILQNMALPRPKFYVQTHRAKTSYGGTFEDRSLFPYLIIDFNPLKFASCLSHPQQRLHCPSTSSPPCEAFFSCIL
jgi:hypothetical protein